MVWLPDSVFVPDQLPDAVQLVAFVVDQVNFDVAPDATEVGDAANVSVGLRLMNADVVFDPPAPVHVRRYATFLVMATVVCVPDSDFVPVQLPDAVQLVAFVDDQVSFDVAPDVRNAGDAVSVTVGAVAASALLDVAKAIATRSQEKLRSKRGNAHDCVILETHRDSVGKASPCRLKSLTQPAFLSGLSDDQSMLVRKAMSRRSDVLLTLRFRQESSVNEFGLKNRLTVE